MITFTGVHVFPVGEDAPTLLDMAVSLGRQPRFGGHTRRWWPVLLHSLVCEELLRVGGCSQLTRLHGLIHDGHESVTCDIPTAWKTDETRKQQWDLDIRIYRKLQIPMPDWEANEFIVGVDAASLHAEAALFGPPGITGFMGEEPTQLALDVVESMARAFPTPIDTDGPNSPGVKLFVLRADTLIGEWRDSLHGNSKWAK